MLLKQIFILILISSFTAHAAFESCPDFERKCTALVDGQDKDISRLKLQVKAWEEKSSEFPNALPFYVWLGAGILAGSFGTLYLTKEKR